MQILVSFSIDNFNVRLLQIKYNFSSVDILHNYSFIQMNDNG